LCCHGTHVSLVFSERYRQPIKSEFSPQCTSQITHTAALTVHTSTGL
jgi:hypothetical protein